MLTKRMLVLYFSGSGSTEKMANLIAETVKLNGIDVILKKAEGFEVKALPEYDAIVLGSPTYFSNMAWPVKKIVDESIIHYRGGKLQGKVAGAFTSSGTARDGKDCLKMLEVALGFHHKMKVIEGIVSVASEGDEEMEKKCRDYGKRLAEEIKRR
jgi:NAD(P)H dehydrogenase (quinone)